jgi:hypothetical protein
MGVTSISFAQDLSEAYIYVENLDVHPLKILKVILNGEDMTSISEIMGDFLGPKDKTVIVVKPENGFNRGENLRVEIEAEGRKFNSEIRVFPAVFPVGMYGGGAILSDRDSIHEAIEMGIDTMVAGINHLDVAQKYGFKVIASAPRTKGLVDLETLSKFSDHPALLAWYVIDEPDISEVKGLVPAGWTAEWTGKIKVVDKRNPTYIVLCNPLLFERFAKIPDILAIDPYPVSIFPLSFVSLMARRATLAAAPSPVWMIPQAFRHGRPTKEGYWGWNRFPASDEERIMVFMGLSHGLKGVIYFTYGSSIDNPDDPYEGISSRHIDAIMLKRAIAQMSGELHALGPLVSMSDVFTETFSGYVWSRTGSVETSSVLSGNEAIILFAVNHNYVSTEKGFKINPVENIIVESHIPKWFNIGDAFLVTQDGLEDIKVRKTGENKISLIIPRVETAVALVLAKEEKTRKIVEMEWSIWRRC